MHIIYKKECFLIIRGTSVLACGGGLSYIEQVHYLNKLPLKKGIKILDVHEINNRLNQVCVTASEIGPADKPPIKKNAIPNMITKFEKTFGKKIMGLLPVELGQESIVFDAALQSNLPIIDTDLAGMRAVPHISDNILESQKVVHTRSPFIILTHNGKIITIPKQYSLKKDEFILRSLVKRTAGIIFLIGGLFSPQTIKKYLGYRSLTTSLEIGRALRERKNFVSSLPLPLVFKKKAKIQSISYLDSSIYSEKRIILSSIPENDILEIDVKNEYLDLNINNKIKYTFPQLITIVDPLKKRGLSGSELRKGMEIVIYVFQPMIYVIKQKTIH